MVFGRKARLEEEELDLDIFPLAFPLLAGLRVLVRLSDNA